MENSSQKYTYFRDAAKKLGMVDALERTDPTKRLYEPLEPNNPRSKINGYLIGDLAVWEYIIEHQEN